VLFEILVIHNIKILLPKIEHIKYFSDGAASQYKNLKMSPFMYVTQRRLDYLKSGISLQPAMETACEAALV